MFSPCSYCVSELAHTVSQYHLLRTQRSSDLLTQGRSCLTSSHTQGLEAVTLMYNTGTYILHPSRCYLLESAIVKALERAASELSPKKKAHERETEFYRIQTISYQHT